MSSTDVVGPGPISFTNTNGDQMIIPLSALEFSDGKLQLKNDWKTVPALLTSQATITNLAQALTAVGQLTPPPTLPPAPALALTAARTGPETNNIIVTTTTTGAGDPLTAEITVTAKEKDAWPGLTNGADAAQAMGTDAAPGTGLLVVKQGSFTAGPGAPPSVAQATQGKLKPGDHADLKDSGNNTVCTILPRADYAGNAGLQYTVHPDAAGHSFSITATYDSSSEQGGTTAITLQDISNLKSKLKPVAYLVTASAPPTGAMVPADGFAQFSGGATGIAATGLLYA